MYSDEIISEVWRHRDAYEAQHEHDLKKIIADIKYRQQKTQNQLIDRRERTKGTQHPFHCLRK